MRINNVKKIVILISLLGAIFLVALIAFCLLLVLRSAGVEKNTDISYNGLLWQQITCNDDYIAYWDQDKIVIEMYDGTEVTSLCPEKEEIGADQIVLGKEGYYLLEWEDVSTEASFDAAIVQLDYQSKIKKKVKVQNAAWLTCKDGYLFVGNWMPENHIRPNYLNGFYANYYIEETDFGENLKKISHSGNEPVRIGRTLLYDHTEGYYCTEPEINGYLGTNIQSFKIEDREKHIKEIDNKRERMNFKLLLESVDWSKGSMCQLQEYQSDRYIFGVCNFYDGIDVSEDEIPFEKIKFAVFYRIDCDMNSIEILFQRQEICAILCTENYIIYQTDTGLVKEDYISGEKKNLLLLNEIDNVSIKFQTEMFEVSYQDKLLGFYWDQKDCILIKSQA